MTEQELRDFMAVLEAYLEHHLKPVKPGADHWAKAMKLIKDAVKLQIEKTLMAEANRNQSAIEMAYEKGYQAGQGLKG